MAIASFVIAGWLRHLGFTLDFVRWRDPIVLVGVSALVFGIGELAGVSSLVVWAKTWPGSLGPGMTALLTGPNGEGPQVTSKFAVATLRWWADGTAGIVLAVPAVVALPAFWKTRRGEFAEAALWLACVVAWAIAVLAIREARALMPLLALGILILIWAASRFGVGLASVGTLVFAMTAAAGFALRRGAFAAADPSESVVFIWGFLGVLTAIGLFIAALLAERDRSRQDLRDAGDWYKRLFESDPRALWVHDAANGRIIAVNEQALRTFGHSRDRISTLRIDTLFGAESGRSLLAAAATATRVPVEIRYQRAPREYVDLDVSSLPSVVDGRKVHFCFAHDVTERNVLRRALVERTDVERRRLAAELRAALAAPLRSLRLAVVELERAIGNDAPVLPILETITARVRQAAMACRECAHRASPLQASDGDFVVAMHNLYKYVPASDAPRVNFSANLEAPIKIPDEQAENLYELVREAVTQCVARQPEGPIDVQVSSTAESIQIAVAAASCRAGPSSNAGVGRESAIRLRAMAMGARLWAQVSGDGGMRLVCECLNAPAA